MIPFRFPFRWGGPATSASTAAGPTLWTQTVVASQQWLAPNATLRRFEPLFPEADTGPQWVQVTDVVS